MIAMAEEVYEEEAEEIEYPRLTLDSKLQHALLKRRLGYLKELNALEDILLLKYDGLLHEE